MAKFEISERLTGAAEGGYAFNKSDTGGRTINGISYNNWPNWKGWPIVMSIISKVGENAKLIDAEVRKNSDLKLMISQFYKQNFWDINKLDLIQDQQLANTVYDFGVNSGTSRSAKFLQQSINSCYNSGLVVDGKIGNATLSAVNIHSKNEPEVIYNEFNSRRKEFYISIAKGNQAQFLKSWLSRLKPYTK